MTTTIRTKVAFRTTSKAKRAKAVPSTRLPSSMARRLALAHFVEQLVGDGALRDYAHAARLLGVTRARMTQILDLLLLAPSVQERVLEGERFRERELRAALREPAWRIQQQALPAP